MNFNVHRRLVRLPVARQKAFPCRLAWWDARSAVQQPGDVDFMKLEYVIAQRTNGANPFKIFESLPQLNPEVLAFALKRMPYTTFMRTAYWFAVSHVVKSRAGMRCQVCNSQNGIQAHHRTYDTHGYEHLNLIDLTVLCENCHGLFHGHKEPEYVPQRLNKPGLCKLRIPKNFVVPHTKEDIKIPEGEVVILTPELIRNCRTNGSFTNATLRALGLTRATMVKGWVSRLVGVSITTEQYRAAIEGRYTYKSGRLD